MRKFFMGILWSITTSESLDKTNNLPSFLETGLLQGRIHKMGEEGVGCNKDMPAGDENAQNSYCPLCKELL